MLAVPSLKPIRLRGVAWLRLVEAVRPKPSCDQRITTVPRPIRARLRIAWKATWGSSEQAWTQRSPPLSSWFSSSAGGGGRERLQRRRSLRRQAERRAFEQARAEAEGDGQAGGEEADGLAGVVG